MRRRAIGDRIVVTRGIAEAVKEDCYFVGEIGEALLRFQQCDWGEMCDEDINSNNEAFENVDARLFAAYNTTKDKIWIITEADRSVTTILFPSEY